MTRGEAECSAEGILAFSWRSQVVGGPRSREAWWTEPRQKAKRRRPGPERQDWDSETGRKMFLGGWHGQKLLINEDE